MIRRIQALNYRCLRYADVRLDRFHVLVGPNASGKSTLFDVVAFLGDLVRDDLDAAIEKRTRNFQDLVWGRPKHNMKFELAVEFEVPQPIETKLPTEKDFRVFRYEIAIREVDGQFRIDSERGLLMSESKKSATRQKTLFPDPPPARGTILVGGGRRAHGRYSASPARALTTSTLRCRRSPAKDGRRASLLGLFVRHYETFRSLQTAFRWRRTQSACSTPARIFCFSTASKCANLVLPG